MLDTGGRCDYTGLWVSSAVHELAWGAGRGPAAFPLSLALSRQKEGEELMASGGGGHGPPNVDLPRLFCHPEIFWTLIGHALSFIHKGAWGASVSGLCTHS